MGDSDKTEDVLGLQTALWIPAWHELDQSLAVGANQKLYFYHEIPGDLDVEKGQAVLFNGVDATVNCDARFAEVVKIEHPVVGEILKVDTFGLDYILYPSDGEEIVVDAEENPGQVHSGTVDSISDWTLRVTLRMEVV